MMHGQKNIKLQMVAWEVDVT